MAWIIGAAVFIILFLTTVYVVAGIAVSAAGSYLSDRTPLSILRSACFWTAAGLCHISEGHVGNL